MLRFRLLYHGEPGAALEWFEKFCADVMIEYGRPDPKDPHRKLAERYPRSLRVGTYREMLTLPTGDSSVTISMGRNGRGDKQELREGFLEFNPTKTYPSKQLEYVYHLLDMEPNVKLELVRWDFATDYPIERASVALMRDGRKYGCVISDSYTSYLGRRSNNGFVKVYDKRAEQNKKGKAIKDPITRVEITIDEPAETLEKLWARVVLLPESVPDRAKGLLRLVLLATLNGVDLEEALECVSRNKRAEYRNVIGEMCGEIAPPAEYAACRRNALAWSHMYGGNGYADR